MYITISLRLEMEQSVGGESSRYLLWFSMESIGSHPLIHTMKYFWISPYRLLLARELHWWVATSENAKGMGHALLSTQVIWLNCLVTLVWLKFQRVSHILSSCVYASRTLLTVCCLYLIPLKFFLLYKFSCVLYVNATSIKVLHQAVRVQASYSYSFNNPELAWEK